MASVTSPVVPAAERVLELDHRTLANAIRALAMDAVEAANSGHPGMPMGMADVATVLFGRFLKFDPTASDWPDRDRFVLSAGHGSMLLYALLHLTGYPEMTIAELKRFRQLGSRSAGHPEYGHAAGIETTTGPLGQGLANAVGMALAERVMAARFGAEIVDHCTYVIAGDGDLMEGISHEAASLAGHLRLAKLIVLFDDNRISIDGPTDLSVSDDQPARFRAYGWHTAAVDGHDPEAVAAAIAAAQRADLPSLIACRTQIAYGAPKKAGTAAAHGAPLGQDEIAGARAALGWPHAPFEIPEPVRVAWRAIGSRGAALRGAWQTRLDAIAPEKRADLARILAGRLPDGWQSTIAAAKRGFIAAPSPKATRQSSGEVLDALAPVIPELLGGSADLTGSNNTRAKTAQPIKPGAFGGGYVFYGVREHAMGAVMNGLALHKGVVPFGGTFLIFSDYLKPALRLSALMRQRVIYVLTHDSIGLGEDGPTHQPIEQLAGLRAIPGLWMFRPADAIETAECWELALARTDGPSALALTRQSVPLLRRTEASENMTARGAYVLAEADGARRATLLATGSEVALAFAAREALAKEGIGAAVVSMPCWALFEAQPKSYRDAVLGPGTLRIGIEAACSFGWDRYLGENGKFIGMSDFGASAPAPDLYRHFGITAEAIVAAVKSASAG